MKVNVTLVQAAGGRRMTGHEAVSCTVTAPDGKVHAVPVTLADGSGHFLATLHWLQVGVHKVRPLPPAICTAECFLQAQQNYSVTHPVPTPCMPDSNECAGLPCVWSKNVEEGPSCTLQSHAGLYAIT